jgi:hypothetical protein
MAGLVPARRIFGIFGAIRCELAMSTAGIDLGRISGRGSTQVRETSSTEWWHIACS